MSIDQKLVIKYWYNLAFALCTYCIFYVDCILLMVADMFGHHLLDSVHTHLHMGLAVPYLPRAICC